MVEFVREPDAQLGYFGGFVTMGMILSLPLLAIGIWLLLRSRKFSMTPLEKIIGGNHCRRRPHAD